MAAVRSSTRKTIPGTGYQVCIMPSLVLGKGYGTAVIACSQSPVLVVLGGGGVSWCKVVTTRRSIP